MPYFFNSNKTGFCQTNEVISKISNLTASYATTGNGGGQQELMKMVCAPIIMFILIALFLCGTFDVRAVLSPNLRLLLSSALALFLPVMSYLFSEAKDAAGGGCQRSATSEDLSVRARVILTWMLLVELLRKKVDEIRLWGSYSNTIQRAGRVVWLGSLVYFNITSPGRKAVFSVLWILCAIKLLQRIVFTEVEKRSYPDKSWLISSYMAQIMPCTNAQARRMQQHRAIEGDDLLRRCRYIVMGEEKLIGEVTADGYKLKINDHGCYDDEVDSGIITVGKLWQVPEISNLLYGNASIRRVFLSFALFKLLRRRFEHLPPMTAEEARNCREILLSIGASTAARGDDEDVQPLFSVMADEVKFFSEYYHSVVPVVLASPLFILVNYFLVPVVVLILCLIAVAVCGGGDVSHTLSSIGADNYALQPGFAKLAICVLVRSGHSRPAFLFTLDLLVTLLLFIIFFIDEIWEFLTVLISNWFIISMVCNYVNKPNWRASTIISGTFRWTLWLRRKMSKYTNIRLKQFSLLSNHRGLWLIAALVPGTLYLNVKSVLMTHCLKRLIGVLLADTGDGHVQLGRACRRCDYYYIEWAFGSESTTEVILTWHIATCLLEAMDVHDVVSNEQAAVSLSRYCAYLVVFHPELLPDRNAKVELVLKEAKEELRKLLGFWGYYLPLSRARAQKLLYSTQAGLDDGDGYGDDPSDGVIDRGIRLAKKLYEDLFCAHAGWGWGFVSEVWAELLVYAAPAPESDVHVKAHADILREGVELVTVLWAFAMHTDMKRPVRSAAGTEQVNI